MPKRKKTFKESNKTHNIIKYSSIVAIIILLLAITGLTGYYFGFDAGKEQMKSKYAKEQQDMLAKLKKATKIKPKKSHKERLNALLEKHKSVLASHEYDKKPPKGAKRKIIKSISKPKLAIIIDDVSFARDVKRIKELKIPLTMSFLPPNKRHPNSAKLAAKEPYYMVHIPLEAMNFNAEEFNTLRAKDSQQKIMKSVENIKKLFPKVKYVNNHTGSKFTANEIAMNRLIFALRKKKIMFIDSRTTAKTKVPRVMKNYGLAYIARDVFLDHEADVHEIKKQIKRAIAIAKRSGSAIAIGHPRPETLQAIRESKYLFKEVKLVGINDYL
jgi:polysaccharide deacetylase 2 family uncharacterized protein YibQ